MDEVVPEPVLVDVGAQAAAPSWRTGRSSRSAQGIRLVENAPAPADLPKAREGVREKTRGHYPAPMAAIDVGREGDDRSPMEEGLKIEAKHFGELAVSDVSRALVSVFFATQEIKKDAGYPEGTEAREVQKLGVVGAGLMGAGIAAGGAEAGVPVRLKDTTLEALGRGLRYVARGVRRAAQAGQPDQTRVRGAHGPLSTTIDYTGFRHVDLVIEAVFEDLDLKRRVLAEVEAATRKDCVFASNTSSLPIGDIARDSWRPARVLGMHFFSPVQKMPLLEVIVTPQTDAWATATAVAVRAADGQTRDRRARRSRLLHHARARAVHERGRAAGGGRGAASRTSTAP